MTNPTLVKLLQDNTEELKVEYIDRCKLFADSDFDRKQAWLDNLHEIQYDAKGYLSQQWYEQFDVRFEESKHKGIGGHVFVTYVRGWDNEKKYWKAKNKIEKVSKILAKGKVAYIADAEKNANAHYQFSIEKLAYRIEKKGLNIEKIERVGYSRIGINLEITFSDGEKSVKAWTIVAEGPIIAPHYRYLVK